MSFVSVAFALFFAVVLALRAVLDRLGQREAYLSALVACSLVFYGWYVPAYLPILLFTTGVDFVAARRMVVLPPASRGRTALLVLSLTVNLGLLALFKYYDFAAANLVLLARIGIPVTPPPAIDLALPLGISFYTFEGMSYAIDVYRGRLAPARRPRDYLLFISFFPHLVSGPIVRARDFLYQVGRRRRLRLSVAAAGSYLMIRGFFLKVVVADNVGAVVDRNWQAAAQPGANASLALLVTALFAVQILCDFDGYTSIARGTAYLLGFRLPVNFDHPYVAGTFRSFWQRWHITLSQWLRDYLYVPLGGNRGGRGRTYANLLVVMLLGGLWHGANYTFVLWGGLHGAGLAVERALGLHTLGPGRGRALQILWFAVVQSGVLLAWVLFRSPTLTVAGGILRNVIAGRYRPLWWAGLSLPTLGLLVAPVVGGHVRAFVGERLGIGAPSPVTRGVWAAVMLYAAMTAYGPQRAFIYFQF